MKELSRVRPLMYASGITSIDSFSLEFKRRIPAQHIVKGVDNGLRYGSTLSCRSPGRNPSRSPASTAGLVSMIFWTSLFFEGIYRHCYCYISLARPCRSDAEHYIVLAYGLNIFFLSECLGLERFSFMSKTYYIF